MKIITKLFGTLIKTVLALLMLALLAPILFFAYRMNRPMDMSEFKGLTYVQYMDWRKINLEDLATNYDQMYPNGMPTNGGNKVKHGICFGTNAIGDILLKFPMAGVYVLSVAHENDWPEGWVPQFLSTWWQTFEEWVWSWAEAAPNDPVIYCRLQPNIPTPDQYEAMKQERTTTTP